MIQKGKQIKRMIMMKRNNMMQKLLRRYKEMKKK